MQNKSALYLLITANAVSGFAQGISMLAIPWYFASVLQAGSTFGVIYGAVTFMTLFWGLYVGTLIDRYSRKKIFMTFNVVGGIFLGIIAATGYYWGSVPEVLVGLVFCFTMFIYNIHYPTLYAFGQEIMEKNNYGKINSIIEVQGQAINVLSGAFAAILITGVDEVFLASIGLNNINISIKAWKIHEIFLLDASTYFIAFILIAFIKYQPIKATIIDTGSLIYRLKVGISFLKQEKLLFYFGVCSFSVFALLLIHIHQLMPIYVNQHLHSTSAVYAGAETIFAIGALFSGIGIRWVFKNTTTVKAIIILMIISIVVFELLFISQSALILILVCFILGISNAGIRVLRVTYLFNHIPNHIIGRSGSIFQTINVLMRFTFITLFSFTFFTTSNNIIWTYFIAGFFILITVIPLLFHYKKMILLNPKS